MSTEDDTAKSTKLAGIAIMLLSLVGIIVVVKPGK